MAARPDFVPLRTFTDPFEAQVVAARLGAEGVICQLRGAASGPYPVGPTVLWVETARADDAHLLLMPGRAEVDGLLEAD